MKTKQIESWDGDFGKSYTNRNKFSMDNNYIMNYGITRKSMNKEFLNKYKFNNILEIGSNIGNQLLLLQQMGYDNLWGIDVSQYAIKISKENTDDINIIKASVFDIPYKDNYFDLVFTSGVLIHINPDDINKALDEIYRVSNKYIWGFEYYSDTYEEIEYRGKKNLLWKTDFMTLFLNRFKDLKVIKEKKFKYLNTDNIDMMYLLKKEIKIGDFSA